MPGDPPTVSAWSLTGKRRHRIGWRGHLILQVQEGRKHGYARPEGSEWDDGPQEMRWRDAVLADVQTEVV